MKECTVIDQTRRVLLWTILGSAAGVLILQLLQIWEVLEVEYSFFGDYSTPWWQKLESSLGIVLMLSLVSLLAILVSRKAKHEAPTPAAAKKAPAKKK
jgi:hypothetical protein